MHLVILFDICDPKRLRTIAKLLNSYGIRVQNSVFEVKTHHKKLIKLKTLINKIIKDQDRVHYYQLCHKDLQSRKADGLGVIMLIPNYVSIV